MNKFTILSCVISANLFISGVSVAASLTSEQQWVLNDLSSTNLNTAGFPWSSEPYAGSLDGHVKRWDISPGHLVPVKLNGSVKAAEAIQTIENLLGMQLFDTQSIALTPDDQINRGVIVSLGTAFVMYTPDDMRNQANVSAGPYLANYPSGFYQANGEISTKLYVNLGTSMISESDINSDVVAHEFFHALGFGSHFPGFGEYLGENDPYFSVSDTMSFHAVDVMKTLYSNPIGTAANDLTIYASAAPVPVGSAGRWPLSPAAFVR